MAFSHDVGFYGIAEVGGTTLLATGGSVNLTQDPMFSSGVWGAGWYNAANQVAYAFNPITLEGDISFELTAGNVFTTIKDWGFEARDTAKVVKLLPNGVAGFNGNAYCSGVSFDCSEGSVVTGSLNFASDQTSGFSTGVQTGDRTGIGTAPAPDSLFPFYQTAVSADGTEIPVISWSASYSSTINFLTVCKSHSPALPVNPDYIMLGGMDADGSFTVFGLSSEVSTANLQSAKSISIAMAPTAGTAGTINIPYIIYSSAGTSIVTGGDYISADLSFTAVGDGTKPPLSIS